MKAAKQLLRDQAIKFLRDQALISYVACVATIVAVGFLLHNDKVPNSFLWVVSLIVLLTVSFCLRYFNEVIFKTKKCRELFGCIMNIIDAVAISSSLYFVPLASTDLIVFINSTLFLLCMGSAMTSAGYGPLLWSFSGPILSIEVIAFAGYYLYTETFIFGLMFFTSASAFFLVPNISKISREALLAAINARLQAERANQSKTRFFAASTHDLRQPVAASAAFTFSAIKQNKDKNLEPLLNKVLDAIQMTDAQLAPMMELARIDSDNFKINRKSFDLVECLDDVMLMFEPRLNDAICFVRKFDVDSVSCNSDIALFKRVVSNIIDNSIKYTQQGSITVSLSIQHASIIVNIRDTGIGIDKDKIELIFDEFYQVNNQHLDPEKGYGLGLPIAKRLSDKLDIRLSIESKIGEYASVKMDIPK